MPMPTSLAIAEHHAVRRGAANQRPGSPPTLQGLHRGKWLRRNGAVSLGAKAKRMGAEAPSLACVRQEGLAAKTSLSLVHQVRRLLERRGQRLARIQRIRRESERAWVEEFRPKAARLQPPHGLLDLAIC